MKKLTEAERRKKIRVPVQSKIRHSQYQVLGTPIFQENSSIDLSSGGISFETARDYKRGDLILLEVEVEGNLLKLLVCAAWVKKLKNELIQVGAELIAVDPDDKKKMQTHLNRLIAKIRKREPKKKVARKVTPKKALAKKKTSKKLAKKKTAKRLTKKKKS